MVAVGTLIAGVLVFVIGQSIQRFLLEPIQEQRRVIADIATAQLFLANVAPPPAGVPIESLALADSPQQAMKTLRALAARARATTYTIPFYDACAACRFIPTRETMLAVSVHLVGWSNTVVNGYRGEHREAVAHLLGFPSD